MAEAKHFDWPALMRLGLHGLKLKPADFWALTPAELTVMLGLDETQKPMGRTRLEELARAFPDHVPGMNEGDSNG